jgi:hypothetical protein
MMPFVVSCELVEQSNHERLNHPYFDRLPSTGFLRQAQDERLSLFSILLKDFCIFNAPI